MGDSNTYKSTSPFGRCFDRALKNCKEEIDKLEVYHKPNSFQENDKYFLPQFPIFFVTHYMPICPLWTS